MQELEEGDRSNHVNYLNDLLQKNSRTLSKASKYVALKNIEIS